MTTQTEIRTPDHVSGRIVERMKVNWTWVAVIYIGITMITMVLILVNEPAATPSSLAALQASSARYEGLAAEFESLREAGPNSAFLASTARYQGLADFYASRKSVSQRALDASSARYQGLADLFTGNKAVNASTARYQGLADMFAEMNVGQSQRALDASSARYQALAELYGATK